MNKLRIDVWSDIACPWCYVGKRRLEAGLASCRKAGQVGEVEIVWRAFELDPDAPREQPADVGYAERLARKYGCSVEQAEEMIARMSEVARADGLDFHFELARPGCTFDAHRLLHLARDRGVQDAVKERLLRGYLTEGEPIGQREALVRLAAEAGLDAQEARSTLATDAYANDVRADEHEAHRLGIQGVPFFVLGGRLAVSGAQPAPLLARALTQAWSDLEAGPEALGEGDACGLEGCD